VRSREGSWWGVVGHVERLLVVEEGGAKVCVEAVKRAQELVLGNVTVLRTRSQS
jgi:hypothetical protein